MQGKYECTYGARYMYVYLRIQLYRWLKWIIMCICIRCLVTYVWIHQYCLTILAEARHGRIRLGRQLGSQKEFIPAQRAKQHAERLANAEHSSCFAQLRAEASENDARDASGKSKNEKSHFWAPPSMNIFTPVKLIAFQLWSLMPPLWSLQLVQNSYLVPWQDHYTNAL